MKTTRNEIEAKFNNDLVNALTEAFKLAKKTNPMVSLTIVKDGMIGNYRAYIGADYDDDTLEDNEGKNIVMGHFGLENIHSNRAFAGKSMIINDEYVDGFFGIELYDFNQKEFEAEYDSFENFGKQILQSHLS